MSNTYHGSCLCKAIKYRITGEPFTFMVCHCVNCRKATGSAFMSNAFFKPDQVVITHGEEIIKHYRDGETASGTTLIRSFCPTCASSIFLSHDTKDFVIVAMGTLDDTVSWLPRRENFSEGKRHWVAGINTAPKSQSKL